jgi:hypothetical protein
MIDSFFFFQNLVVLGDFDWNHERHVLTALKEDIESVTFSHNDNDLEDLDVSYYPNLRYLTILNVDPSACTIMETCRDYVNQVLSSLSSNDSKRDKDLVLRFEYTFNRENQVFQIANDSRMAPLLSRYFSRFFTISYRTKTRVVYLYDAFLDLLLTAPAPSIVVQPTDPILVLLTQNRYALIPSSTDIDSIERSSHDYSEAFPNNVFVFSTSECPLRCSFSRLEFASDLF